MGHGVRKADGDGVIWEAGALSAFSWWSGALLFRRVYLLKPRVYEYIIKRGGTPVNTLHIFKVYKLP